DRDGSFRRADVHRGSRAFFHLLASAVCARRRGVDGVLFSVGWFWPWILVVQLSPGANVYGRYRFAGDWRGAWNYRGVNSSTIHAGNRGRRVRGGSSFGDHPTRL